MTRTLTPQHLEAMQHGAQQQRANARKRHQADVSAYRRWLKLDAAAYHDRSVAEAMEGRGSQAFRDADLIWRTILTDVPPIPSDAAFEQEAAR